MQKLSILEKDTNLRQESTKNNLIGVKVFTQEEAYYCGPATVKQTLTYINRSAPSPKNIADNMGTTEKR